jgi:hypothetical protein
MIVAKFCYGCRAAMLGSLLRFPRSVLAEVKYLLTGRVSTKDGHLPSYIVSFPKEPTLEKPDDRSIRVLESRQTLDELLSQEERTKERQSER